MTEGTMAGVFLAAATTVLGMPPLLPDAFCQLMAATIVGKLALASILTLTAVPVLYHMVCKRPVRREPPLPPGPA